MLWLSILIAFIIAILNYLIIFAADDPSDYDLIEQQEAIEKWQQQRKQRLLKKEQKQIRNQ